MMFGVLQMREDQKSLVGHLFYVAKLVAEQEGLADGTLHLDLCIPSSSPLIESDVPLNGQVIVSSSTMASRDAKLSIICMCMSSVGVR